MLTNASTFNHTKKLKEKSYNYNKIHKICFAILVDFSRLNHFYTQHCKGLPWQEKWHHDSIRGSEEVRCSLRSLLALSQQLTTMCYFSMNRRVKKDQVVDIPWSWGNYQQTLLNLCRQQAQLCTCDWALDRGDILSMTCQVTLSSLFWSEVLGFLTSSQLCFSYNFNSVLPLIPCPSLWFLLSLRNSGLKVVTAIHAELMPIWTLGLPGAVKGAQRGTMNVYWWRMHEISYKHCEIEGSQNEFMT